VTANYEWLQGPQFETESLGLRSFSILHYWPRLGRHINLLVALACCAVRDTHTLRYFLLQLHSSMYHHGYNSNGSIAPPQVRWRLSVVGCNRGWLVVAYQITQLRCSIPTGSQRPEQPRWSIFFWERMPPSGGLAKREDWIESSELRFTRWRLSCFIGAGSTNGTLFCVKFEEFPKDTLYFRLWLIV